MAGRRIGVARIGDTVDVRDGIGVGVVSACASQILRTRELLRALEDHETALGDLVDRESFVAQAGFFADIGDPDAGREFYLLGECQCLVFLTVEDLGGKHAGALVGDFYVKGFGY